MVLLQYYAYTIHIIYTDITNSSLYLIFEIFIAFFCGCSCREGNKNKNVKDHKNQNLREETMLSP